MTTTTTPPSSAALFDAAETAPACEGSGTQHRAQTAAQAGAPHVIGIDPSLTAAGIASSQLWCTCRGYTKARSKDPGITGLPLPQRLTALEQLLDDIRATVGKPDLVVMEAPALSRAGGGAHERAWLWWEIYRGLTRDNIPVAVMSIQQRLIYATGKGSGSKGAVIDAVAKRWPMYDTGGNDNLADAVVFCAAGLDHLGHALATVPQSHHRALDGIAWPTNGAKS